MAGFISEGICGNSSYSTYSTVLNSSTFSKGWVTSRIWNEKPDMGLDGDEAQRELLWLCTWTRLAPCSTPGGNQPQRGSSCKTLNWLNAMRKVLQERCSSAWCLLYAKGPCGFKPIFCLRPPQGWGTFAVAGVAILSSQCCLLPSWCRLIVNHSLGEGSPLNSSFCPSRYTPTSLTYRGVSQLTASTSLHSGSGVLGSCL